MNNWGSNWQDGPGPGDEATWPPYSGHPNDPRNPGIDDDDYERMINDRIDDLLEEPGWVEEAISAESLPAPNAKEYDSNCAVYFREIGLMIQNDEFERLGKFIAEHARGYLRSAAEKET